MAATAVYARLAYIPTAGTPQAETPPAFSNISATTSAFTITNGGLFGVTVKASNYGSVTLQIMGPDDTTWLTSDIAAFSADGFDKATFRRVGIAGRWRRGGIRPEPFCRQEQGRQGSRGRPPQTGQTGA